MLFIYTPNITNRLKYVLNFILEERLGLSYTLCDDEKDFKQTKSAEKIVYGTENTGNGFFIFSHSLLKESDIKIFELCIDKINNDVVFFKNNKDDLGFDVFAAVFYLLCRYEEYLQKPTDKFGNYDYKNSVLHKLNLLPVPVVERWIEMLKLALEKKFPSLQCKTSTAKFALSFDIDVAFAYKNRSIIRTVGGLIKKLISFNFSALANQLLTLFHLKNDVFDTYEYVFNRVNNSKAIFFFNMGSYTAYDKNPSYKNKKFRELIRRVHSKHLTGLHPSYASNSGFNLIGKEKKWLEEITGDEIKISRQHYLKLKLPLTYRALIKNGIEQDFTIGYHDAYGFRAGTCNSFLFFDLEKNENTNLRLFPFSIMEGTLNDVMHLSIEGSKKIISDLISSVKKNNGIFIPLWHNSTLSDAGGWKGWREVFEFMLYEIENTGLENYFDT